MSRIRLIHWKAQEADDGLKRLRRAGHDASLWTPKRGATPAALTRNVPDLFVIDLSCLPGQGRDVGLFLRQRKATRNVPIVFVGGDPRKVADYKKLLPDVFYTTWARIRSGISKALTSPPRQPVNPGALAGYSGTPLPKKLGIKSGKTVALLSEPKGFRETVGPLPHDIQIRNQARGKADVIVLFVKSTAELKRRLPGAMRMMADGARLWLAWPKKASGTATDLTQQLVRQTGLATGLVDFKIAALDPTWSGLAFTRRRR